MVLYSKSQENQSDTLQLNLFRVRICIGCDFSKATIWVRRGIPVVCRFGHQACCFFVMTVPRVQVVEEVFATTGYERVMMYKFHEDMHGEVSPPPQCF